MPATPPAGNKVTTGVPVSDPRDDPSIKQPTPTEKAAVEAKWGAMVTAPKSLAQLILLVDAHPEWVEWAKASQAGTFRP